MNKEILIKPNKKLVLKNVIKKELKNIPIEQLDKEIQKFQTMVLSKNTQPFGPLIIRNSGTHISENGVTVDTDIIVQANNYKIMKNQFIIEENHICSNCVYAHYDDNSDNIQHVYNKIDLYFYENDLSESGITYTLYLSNEPSRTVIDIFKQVVAI